MAIRDVEFVVTDTETTGARSGTDRVIEVAAVKVRGGKVVGEFRSFVNPQRSVPRRITEITGITTAMVFDQPTADEVLPQYLEFLGDAVFVAHNAPFDERFLNAELARLGRPSIQNPVLCTLRLARRLLTGLRSKSLGSVANFYGIPIVGRHRALGDATATAEVLRRFLDQLTDEHELETLDDLLAFQHRTYARARKSKEPKYLQKIRTDILPQLPGRPGVYFMKDRRGAIIYIGKAKRLSDRVRSYFTAIEAHPPRIRNLVESVRDVSWEETGSELAALLRESKLIKEVQPRFNRAARRYRNRPFIRLDLTEAFPSVSWVSYLKNDGAAYYGPLGGRRQAELVVDFISRFYRLRECDADTFARGKRCLYAEMGRCPAPCEDASVAAAYAHEVARVQAFLTGKDDTLLERLEDEMSRAAERMEFEEAAFYRDWVRKLEKMQRKQQAIAAPVLEHNAVLVQPGLEPDTAQLFLVRFGRLAETLTVSLEPTSAERAELAAQLARIFDPARAEPERYFKPEVDEIRLLAHWLYVHRDEAVSIRWEDDQPVEVLLEAVLARLPAVEA